MAWRWNFWKKKPSRPTYEFTEDDRLEAESAILLKKIKKTRQQRLKQKLEHLQELEEEASMAERIEQLEEKIYGQEEEGLQAEDVLNPDTLILNLLNSVLAKGQGSAPKPGAATQAAYNLGLEPPISQAPGIPQETGGRVAYSDHQIKAMRATIPAEVLAQLKTKPDDELISILLDKYPEASDDTIKRAVAIIKEAA